MRIIPKVSYTFLDYPDPSSHSLLIYFSGCDNKCVGCQNPILSNFLSEGSKSVTLDDLDIMVSQATDKCNTNKITLSGGDPCYSHNINGVNSFIKRNKNRYDICIYTGKSIDFIKEKVEPGFKFVKVNKFDSAQQRSSIKTDEFFQLSSPNQAIYDGEYNCLSENGIYYFKKGV